MRLSQNLIVFTSISLITLPHIFAESIAYQSTSVDGQDTITVPASTQTLLPWYFGGFTKNKLKSNYESPVISANQTVTELSLFCPDHPATACPTWVKDGIVHTTHMGGSTWFQNLDFFQLSKNQTTSISMTGGCIFEDSASQIVNCTSKLIFRSGFAQDILPSRTPTTTTRLKTAMTGVTMEQIAITAVKIESQDSLVLLGRLILMLSLLIF